jgi:hypothetical protein
LLEPGAEERAPLHHKKKTKHKMNFKITTLLFAFALLSVSAFAEAPASVAVVSAPNTGVYNVYYRTAVAGEVKVSIKNSSNKVVFTEVLSNVASFKRPYNFSQLPHGEYTIVIEDKNGKKVEQVNYTLSKIESNIRVSRVANTTDKYVVNVTSTGAEDVYVKISSGSTVLHEQTILVDKSFGLIYNLSQLKSKGGNITFEVITESGTSKVAAF